MFNLKWFLLVGFFHIFAIVTTEDYIINNEKCKMPNFPAYSEETNPFYISLPYINCTDSNLLTYTSVKNNTAYLHIDRDNLDQYYSTRDMIDCCYSYVRREGSENFPDIGISFSTCTPFNSTVALQEDIVSVKCYLDADKIYENVHTTIVVTEAVKQKLQKFQIRKESKRRPLSVLFIVIDSVARLNFERTMPLTREFILENNFTDYMAYSKIDDNTFPNFNALITGLNLKQSNEICKPYEIGQLNKCPMIWYDFRDSGYATAYAEDWAEISTYNYLKKGFTNPPTDYYFKPYMEAAKGLGTTFIDTMPFCAGPETQGERILDIAKDFSTTFKDQPNFGIFWMNTFSHNYLNTPSRMDQTFKKFMEDLKSEGILDSSMVVLLADHGMRFGRIRQTNQGWYEERLPMNFISLPPWFKEEYPRKYQNFKDNSKKLTSTYDFYLTLQDILAMSVSNYTMTGSKACPTCASFFAEIPEKRSCSKAGVPERWCTCIGKFENNHTDLTPEIQKAAVTFIMDSDVLRPTNTSINKIESASITYFNKKMYLKFIVEADNYYIYQVVLRATNNPIKFVKVVNIVQLWKRSPISFK
ncbi:uncharacterized protein LOC114339588 [Diabrotica virgifera virgifera]|uniref:DUF229 domain containing protein n=1 Tax=Diabrotica virgifera virgifera TaxID=50390 RepID=A0ABM5IWX1_DIAVI|nr:uncharacterized protein LOC114339588 [Diabrotica virgifera virgifera]